MIPWTDLKSSQSSWCNSFRSLLLLGSCLLPLLPSCLDVEGNPVHLVASPNVFSGASGQLLLADNLAIVSVPSCVFALAGVRPRIGLYPKRPVYAKIASVEPRSCAPHRLTSGRWHAYVSPPMPCQEVGPVADVGCPEVSPPARGRDGPFRDGLLRVGGERRLDALGGSPARGGRHGPAGGGGGGVQPADRGQRRCPDGADLRPPGPLGADVARAGQRLRHGPHARRARLPLGTDQPGCNAAGGDQLAAVRVRVHAAEVGLALADARRGGGRRDADADGRPPWPASRRARWRSCCSGSSSCGSTRTPWRSPGGTGGSSRRPG